MLDGKAKLKSKPDAQATLELVEYRAYSEAVVFADNTCSRILEEHAKLSPKVSIRLSAQTTGVRLEVLRRFGEIKHE